MQRPVWFALTLTMVLAGCAPSASPPPPDVKEPHHPSVAGAAVEQRTILLLRNHERNEITSEAEPAGFFIVPAYGNHCSPKLGVCPVVVTTTQRVLGPGCDGLARYGIDRGCRIMRRYYAASLNGDSMSTRHGDVTVLRGDT